TGLRVKAGLDQSYYPRGIKITDKELQAVPLRPHAFHGEWNYTVLPDRTTAV
ncbi:rhodopirellula transposase, partial [mine drainage metagenome]